MQILAFGPGDAKSTGPSKNFHCTHGGTRTPNLRFRRPTPYPLGHAGTVVILVDASTMNYKITVRRPGIEPGSQEWESCMIPLHQRRQAVICEDRAASATMLLRGTFRMFVVLKLVRV